MQAVSLQTLTMPNLEPVWTCNSCKIPCLRQKICRWHQTRIC